MVSADAKLQLSLICSSTLSVGPDEISALFMFNYIASAGDENNPGTMFRLLNTSGGAQERFFDGGAYRVPRGDGQHLADTIVYNAPVSTHRHPHRQGGRHDRGAAPSPASASSSR